MTDKKPIIFNNPPNDTPNLDEKQLPVLEKKKGTITKVLDNLTSPWRSRNRTKKAQGQTVLFDSMTDLGEAGLRFRKTQDKLKDVKILLKTDTAERAADLAQQSNRLAEETRKAGLQEKDDQIAELQKDIALEQLKQEKERLVRPLPIPTPKIKKKPRKIRPKKNEMELLFKDFDKEVVLEKTKNNYRQSVAKYAEENNITDQEIIEALEAIALKRWYDLYG